MHAEVIIVGGGLAGLSAAIYLGRAKRDALVIDNGKSMARWEPDVQNYLGFPKGICGSQLLELGRQQARRYEVKLVRDEIESAHMTKKGFGLRGRRSYTCKRLLLATGIFHVPPDIPGVRPCLGHSMFFCKDCDGYRVQGKRIGIYGWTDEAVKYALEMLTYSRTVFILTDGRSAGWDSRHARWLKEYRIRVYLACVTKVRRKNSQIEGVILENGGEVEMEALFTTRGDIYLNELGRDLGAKVDRQGEMVVDSEMRTSVSGLYAAGCVTPANCQMIIGAGEGATAAQAINHDLFRESLATHSLRLMREH